MLQEEIYRKYGVNAAQMYRWKRSLDQGFKDAGEMVPKNQVLSVEPSSTTIISSAV